ncbi:MAG: exonuclease SbcCD subunit D [Faecalibacterium sp.]|nr:exonuclease SbcCD subunit D [Faecalibacterium sp.]
MKLLHLSDLHIGKTLGGVSLLEDQRAVLGEILRLIDAEKPDAVLVAGDLYDRSNPSEDAVRLADWWIGEAAGRGAPLCITSGNHDAAGRIAYLGRVAARAGVYLPHVVEPGFSGLARVALKDSAGPVEITLLPFVRPATVRAALPACGCGTTQQAVQALLAAYAPQKGMRSVLVAHQLVLAGGKAPETGGSEELLVGGVDNIDAALFDAYQYVALGHIHRAQNVKGPRIRYCGAPMQFARDEAGQEKSATLATMDAAGHVTIETAALTPPHKIQHLTGRLEALLAPGFGPGQKEDDYYFITLTDAMLPTAPLDRLKMKYPNLLGLDFDRGAPLTAGVANAAQSLHGKALAELFGEFFAARNGRPLNEQETAVLAEILAQQKAGEGE